LYTRRLLLYFLIVFTAGWGFLKFYPRKQLILGQWSVRDEIRLEANVSVVTGIHHTADSRMPGGTQISSVTQFQHHMASLLDAPKDSDIQFAVTAGERSSGRSIIMKAHRPILAVRSTYFKSMLTVGMAESKTGTPITSSFLTSSFFFFFFFFLALFIDDDKNVTHTHTKNTLMCGGIYRYAHTHTHAPNKAIVSHTECVYYVGRVYIDHCRPSVFKQLLRFLYTGACDLSGVGYDEKPTVDESLSVIQGLDESLADDEFDSGLGGGGDRAATAHNEHKGESKDASSKVEMEPEDGKGGNDDDDLLIATDEDVDGCDEMDEGIVDAETQARKAKKMRSKATKRERIGRQRQRKAVIGRRNDDTVSDAALELLCAADRFDAADLRGLCEHYLMDTLSSLNCIHRCKMADLIGRLSLLRAMCVKFITELSPTVRTSKSFTDQLHSLPKPLLIELLSAQPVPTSTPSSTPQHSPPPPPPLPLPTSNQTSSSFSGTVSSAPVPTPLASATRTLSSFTQTLPPPVSRTSPPLLSPPAPAPTSPSPSAPLLPPSLILLSSVPIPTVSSLLLPASTVPMPTSTPFSRAFTQQAELVTSSRKRGSSDMLRSTVVNGAAQTPATTNTHAGHPLPPPSVISELLGGVGGGGGDDTNVDGDVDATEPKRPRTGNNNPTSSQLRTSDIAAMRVSDLKNELGRRGVSKAGKKAVLQARLSLSLTQASSFGQFAPNPHNYALRHYPSTTNTTAVVNTALATAASRTPLLLPPTSMSPLRDGQPQGQIPMSLFTSLPTDRVTSAPFTRT
jgi:hypothetical protein